VWNAVQGSPRRPFGPATWHSHSWRRLAHAANLCHTEEPPIQGALCVFP
jgi:hypothetical protein